MNSLNPLVSVIIPCYNVAIYVEKAVNSILSQSYHNMEVWIIDDASSDDTLKRINAIKDERIKVVAFKENTRKIAAVNEVLRKVEGDYIAFQDADDWSEPDRIGEQVKKFLTTPGLGICLTNFRYTGKKHFSHKKLAITNEELRKGFLNFNKENITELPLPACATMMISKKALSATGGYHPYFVGRVAEDIHWIYRILKNFDGVTIDRILYNYLLREGSFSQVQHMGVNPKYAYSWQLLSKIISKDVHEGIDVLNPENAQLLRILELEACEEALSENIQLLNRTRTDYESSMSFRIGKFIVRPLRLLRKISSTTAIKATK